MTPDEELRVWLTKRTGIELSRGGVGRVLERVLEERCHELGCSIEAYSRRVREPDSPEFEVLADAITVVYTWFFRDPGQLKSVEEVLRRASLDRPLRIWIPGCATGEDAYSVLLIAESIGVRVSILGTDINTRALAAAESGRYTEHDLRDVGEAKRKHFLRLPEGRFEVDPSLRRNVRFQRHSLVDPVPHWNGLEGWDLILCRNVFIYFEQDRAEQVFERLARALTPNGHLILGASEVVYEVPNGTEVSYVADRLTLRRATKKAPAIPTLPRMDAPAVRVSGGHQHPIVPALPVHAQRISIPPASAQAEPHRSEASLETGHSLLDQGRIDEALDRYAKTVHQDPTCPEARMYLGIARYLCGNVEAAAHELRAALLLGDHLWPAAFYLALSYESMGLPDDALREYRHLVRVCERQNPELGRKHTPWLGWHDDILELARRRLERGGLRDAMR